MKFTQALVAGSAAAMMAAAPVAAQTAAAPAPAQEEENAFGSNGGAIAALFGLLAFVSFIVFHDEDEVPPVSP